MAMTRRALRAVSALSLFFACSASSPKESPVQNPVQVIEEEVLQGILEQGGCVALGKVSKVEPFNQGTRGSRVRISLEVEKQLHGTLPRQVSFLTWGNATTAKVGDQLLFAIKPPVPQFPDAVLLSFFNVPAGKGEEAVRAQQAVLEKVAHRPVEP
ncbi:hypothetical protein [Hyalangium versicolor]|uniref:hypothetical protein n=1 Tax=Hyalangium versicolor TaxID=2861190 RepID=UPI001CCA6093|nr:hypothetical protein [Hyalangium versicolor]